MGKLKTIAFDLQNRVKGQEVTPGTIGLPMFNDFNREVEQFLAGNSERGVLNEAQLKIKEGSYCLEVAPPFAVTAAVESDLAKLDRQDALGEIDAKRAEIITKWQGKARRDPSFSVKIHSPDGVINAIRISRETDFHKQDADEWAAVERYVIGKVVDVGGVRDPNLHILLEDTRRTLIASASEKLLQEPKRNYMFRAVQIQISAQENIRTGLLKDVELLGFVGDAPSFDETELKAFVEKGTKAWADVHDSVAWVNQLREGD